MRYILRMEPTAEDAVQGKPRRPTFLTKEFFIVAGGIAVLAISGLIIVASAVNASVAVQGAADRKAAQIVADHDSAVTDFDDATAACERANSALGTAVINATATLATDRAILADPTLIDALATASTKNSEAALCTAPAMAEETDAIEAQTTALQDSTDDVSSAAESLQNAVDAVTASVQAKADAIAAAAAAAEVAARTWHQDAGNGYTYDVSLAIGGAGSGSPVGSVCTDFDPATDIAVPFTLTVTSTTADFDIPSLSVSLFPYSFAGVGHTSGVWYIGSNMFSATEAGTYEAEEYYGGNGSTCWQPAQSLSAGLLSVTWSSGLAAGATNTWNFTFILKGYKSPAHPDGNPALLSSIGLSPQLAVFWLPGNKALTLNNVIIAG